jgi:hypothetical protein
VGLIISQEERWEYLPRRSDVSVVSCVNISQEISDEWVKIQAKNLGGCEEERGECARISDNMKMLSGCENQPT